MWDINLPQTVPYIFDPWTLYKKLVKASPCFFNTSQKTAIILTIISFVDNYEAKLWEKLGNYEKKWTVSEYNYRNWLTIIEFNYYKILPIMRCTLQLQGMIKGKFFIHPHPGWDSENKFQKLPLLRFQVLDRMSQFHQVSSNAAQAQL